MVMGGLTDKLAFAQSCRNRGEVPSQQRKEVMQRTWGRSMQVGWKKSRETLWWVQGESEEMGSERSQGSASRVCRTLVRTLGFSPNDVGSH